MNLICLAALIAACGAAKLDRTYLPPLSAASAGGSPGSLQTPLTRTSDQSHIIPPGGFINEHEGVVVEATLAGTRTSDNKTGLGGSRESYGSTASKVGDAAFRTTTRKPQSDSQYQSNEYKDYDASKETDLSAFHQPPNTFKPGNVQIVKDYVSDVIKYHNDIGLNKFNYGFETNNGIKTSANGIAIDGVRAQGGFSYTGDDGREYSVSYTADEAGFRPQGSHLPTPHPIPAAILKALEQNARDEAAGIIDDGSYDAKKYNVEDDYSQSSEYNDRLSNKLGHRPGLDSQMTIKQKQPSFGMSNFNEQFGFGFQTVKGNNNKPDAFKFQSGNRNDVENNNAVSKYGQSSSMNSGFGSRNEYLPPKRAENNYSFNVSPHSPQSFQEQNNFGIPHSSSIIPSSLGSSPGPISQGAFPLQSSSLASNIENTQSTLSSFGAADKNYVSISSQAYNKPFRDSSGIDFTLSKNPSISHQSTLSPSNDKATPQNSQSFIPVSSFTSQSSQPSIQSEVFSTVSPLPSKFNSMSMQYFNPSQYTTAYQTQYTKKPSSNFVTSFSSVMATKQPEITLTTPLEETKTSDPSTSFDLNKSELLEVTNLPDSPVTNGQISQFQTSQTKKTLPSAYQNKNLQTTSLDIDKTQTTQLLQNTQVTQDIFTPQRPSDSEFALNTQRPTYYTQSNIFTGQAQEADHSYIYKRPSVPFHTPVAKHQSNNFLNKPLLSHVDRVTQSMTTPLDSTISTKYQSLYTNNNFPNPSTITTFSPSFPTLTEYDSSKTTFQASSDITQASISKFPPIPPTVSSTLKKPSNPFDLKPFQQSELNTPTLSKFTNDDTTVTATTFVQSTVLGNRVSSQSDGNTDTTREVYEYNKPSQGLSSGTEKEEVDLSKKTEKQQFTFSSTQFSQENPTTMSLEGKDVQTDQQKTSIQLVQPNIKPEYASYSYKPSKFFPSTMTTDMFTTENQGPQSSTITLSQKPIIGLQTSTQFVNSDSRETISNFQQPYQEPTTQFDSKQSTSNQGLFQTNPVQTHYTSMTEKISTQLATKQPTQFETQSNTQFFDSKETTSNFQGPYQQTATQFVSKPSTSIPGLFQTNPEQTHYKPITEKLSTQLPTNQPTQFETQSNTQFFDSKETTSNFQGPYQQTATQFDSKPSTSIPGIFQTNPEQTYYKPITEKLSTQLPTNQPTQFETQSNTQFFDSKETTSNFQGPYQQTATQFVSKPSTSIPGLFQTNPEQTHYTSMTEKLSTQLPSNQPTQFETQSYTQFGQENLGNKATTATHYQQSVPQLNSKPPTINMQQSQDNTQNTGKQNEFSTSFVQSIDKPTQFTAQSVQEHQDIFDIKGTTTSQFQEPSKTLSMTFNKPSILDPSTTQTVSPPKTTQFGEIYDYTKPIQGLLIPSQNNVKLNQEKPYFVNHTDKPFNPQTMPIFQKEKPSQFEQQIPESHFNLQSNTQNIQENNGQTGSVFTQANSQSSVQYYTGSTSLPSTPNFDSRVSEQVSTPGELYEYTKPTNGLMTTQNVNIEQMSKIRPQYTTNIDTQHGSQFIPIFQREPTQFAQQTYFTPEYSTENFSTENVKGTTVQQFTQTEQVTSKIFDTDSTPQDQNKLTLDQASTTGESYEYTKPEQGLPSEKESVLFGQEIKMQSGIQTTKSDQDNESQPTIGQSTQAPTTTISISQTESKQNSQNQNTLTSQFTQEFELNKGTLDSRPKLAFHKACCSKLKVQNNDVGSGNPLDGNDLKPDIGTNIIEDNKNISHPKETQVNLPPEPSFSNSDPRKGSETYAGIGEKFGGPRKPPSFDETGYHY